MSITEAERDVHAPAQPAETRDRPPAPDATSSVELPGRRRGYRLKRKLLGPPLRTEELEHERLGQAHRARGVRVRQPLVVGVRDRGDPAGARARGRHRRVLARGPDHGRDARGARVPDPLVPRDDQGLSDGRRRVHGHARQLRPDARAGRGRRAAHRLRAYGRGLGRRRHRRARLGVPRTQAVHRCRSRSRSSASSRTATCAACGSRAASSRCPHISSSSTWWCCSGRASRAWRAARCPSADTDAARRARTRAARAAVC